MLPEAGGSSSFTRRAFNEFVSFGAGWALMLDYIVTIAISAFFVPNYLAVFWPVLRTWPYNSIGGIVVILALVVVNVDRDQGGGAAQHRPRRRRSRHPGPHHGPRRRAPPGATAAHRPGGPLDVADPRASSSTRSPSARSPTPASRRSRTCRRRRRIPIADVPRAINMVLVTVIVVYIGMSLVALSAMPVGSNEVRVDPRTGFIAQVEVQPGEIEGTYVLADDPSTTAYLPVETVGGRTLMPAAETKPTGEVYTRDGVEYTRMYGTPAGQQLHRGPGAGGGALHPGRPGLAARHPRHLGRRARGDHPRHRHQRRADRRVPARLLARPAPAGAADPRPRPPQAHDPVRLHHRVRRRGLPHHHPGQHVLPRGPLRLRGDDLVHRRAHLRRRSADQGARAAGVRSARRSASRSGASPCPCCRSSAASARSRSGASSWRPTPRAGSSASPG